MKTAFTLIEIIIVVSIIIIISTFSLTIYARNIREQKFKYEVSRYVEVLNYAKQNAILQNTEGHPDCYEYSGYRVQMTGKTYTLQLCCSENCNSPIDIQIYQDIHPSIQFTEYTDIHFREKAGGVEGGDKTIIIQSTTLNTCVNIKITSTGLISQEKNDTCS